MSGTRLFARRVQLLFHFAAGSLAVAVVLLNVVGCGGGSKEPSVASSDGEGSAVEKTGNPADTASPESTAPTNSRGQDEVWVDDNGNKFLGQVPFDAFYDQPYTVASNSTPLASGAAQPVAGLPAVATPAADGMPAASTDTSSDTNISENAAATGGEVAWAELIPTEVLESEVKSVRNFLNATLQSVASYNSSMLMIEPKAATVAALAAISEDHSGDISWKEDAAYVRNLAKKMVESPLQRGKKDQARLQTLFENMTDTFNRSRPAGLEEPPAEDSFVDVAEMRFLMRRMEEAEQKLKTEAGSESLFADKKEMVKHEAAILRTFTHLIALEEYGYGDDEKFRELAGNVKQASESIQTAAETGDFSAYQLALSTVSTNCQQCHSLFKNN